MLRFAKKYPLLPQLNDRSPAAESFRKLRMNLRFALENGEPRSILVTSSREGEGKSLIAANLAAAYAQDGKRVLIVDADLHHPVMHQIFPMPLSPGLTEVLQGECPAPEAVRTVLPPGISLLPSGAPAPAELLSSGRMANLLRELSADYDLLLIDSPPALRATDAQALAPLADGVLLVVQSGAIRNKAVRKTKSSLEMAGARLLGAVLNRVGRSNEAYQFYYG